MKLVMWQKGLMLVVVMSHFQIIQGLLDRTMQLLEVPLSTRVGDGGYHLKASNGEQTQCRVCEECAVMYIWGPVHIRSGGCAWIHV